MRIAIHHSPGSFSDRWIEYCEEKKIDFKIVNAYNSDIISQVADCDAFMWHHHHANPKDVLFAKQLLYSLEEAGKRVFPDWHTCWHFDDKVGQKYLLESVGAPLVPSYVFYTKQEALAWIEHTTFPKVFKLRGGAGASNVRLVHNSSEARHLIKIAFGKGFSPVNRKGYVKERYRKWCEGNDSFFGVCKGVARLIIPTEFAKLHAPEKGYIYFQDFIPNNQYDIRVVVIGDKLLSEKRYVRKGDFRASGSGIFDYSSVPDDVIEIAFQTAERLNLQSVAFDFIFQDNRPLIVEMSYAFGFKGLSHCPGYYSRNHEFHKCNFNDFCGWMIENILEERF